MYVSGLCLHPSAVGAGDDCLPTTENSSLPLMSALETLQIDP